MNYTLKNTYGTLSVSDRFVNSCKVFTNLFEDTKNYHNSVPLMITNSYNIDDVKHFVSFYDQLDALEVELDNGEFVSYLDYIVTHREEFIKNYTNMNREPPQCEKVMAIYQNYTPETIQNFIKLDTFFDNEKLIRGIMLCITVFIRIGDKNKINDCMETFMELIQEI